MCMLLHEGRMMALPVSTMKREEGLRKGTWTTEVARACKQSLAAVQQAGRRHTKDCSATALGRGHLQKRAAKAGTCDVAVQLAVANGVLLRDQPAEFAAQLEARNDVVHAPALILLLLVLRGMAHGLLELSGRKDRGWECTAPDDRSKLPTIIPRTA